MCIFGAKRAIEICAEQLTKNVQLTDQINHRATHCLIFIKRHYRIAVGRDLRLMKCNVSVAGLVVQHPHLAFELDQTIKGIVQVG